VLSGASTDGCLRRPLASGEMLRARLLNASFSLISGVHPFKNVQSSQK
jgi:hypothetical protein